MVILPCKFSCRTLSLQNVRAFKNYQIQLHLILNQLSMGHLIKYQILSSHDSIQNIETYIVHYKAGCNIVGNLQLIMLILISPHHTTWVNSQRYPCSHELFIRHFDLHRLTVLQPIKSKTQAFKTKVISL